MSAAWELQTGIYAELTGDAAIMDRVTAVYDHVPQPSDSGDDERFPYIVIGEDTLNEWDTDDSTGFDCTCTIHVWSRKRGRREVKEIQGLIYEALHRGTIELDGYHLVTVQQEFQESFVDPDGLTRQGVQRFRVLIDATS